MPVRVGAERRAASPLPVSPPLSPNRTCQFPGIRLSMRGAGRGCYDIACSVFMVVQTSAGARRNHSSGRASQPLVIRVPRYG